MVRGNWQHRVEKAEARKAQAKQRKQRVEDRQVTKRLFHELLQQLDRHYDAVVVRHQQQQPRQDGTSTIILHLWTDLMPSQSEPLLDLLEEDEASALAVACRSGKKKVRPRSDSNAAAAAGDNNSKTKKKVHPRSKEAHATTTTTTTTTTSTNATTTLDDSETPNLLLCRSAFFHGKCAYNKSKKGGGGCKYLHYGPRFTTLGAVLQHSTRTTTTTTTTTEQLTRLENRFIEASSPTTTTTLGDTLEQHPGAMEMLYHVSIPIPSTLEETIANFVTEQLTQQQTPPSSVFYVTLNETLIFDRLQGGTLLDEREFYNAVTGKSAHTAAPRRSSSIGSEDGSSAQQDVDELVHDLPSTVLEHILLYLPEVSIGAAAQVCQAWHEEIGRHSPNLWQQLLERRHWPVPLDDDDNNNNNNNGEIHVTLCRTTFQAHYVMLRDLRALGRATEAITTRQTIPEVEMAYQDFTRRKNVPHVTDTCVAILPWSDKLILAAHANECALRLYEAGQFGDHNNNNHNNTSPIGELRCKELIFQHVSPYRNTKKRNCRLLAVDLDEHNIGCLCAVSSDYVKGTAEILVVLGRDDFLLGSTCEAQAKAGGKTITTTDTNEFKVIDIGESVLNFVLSMDIVDHRLLPLFDFLNDHGEVGEVVVQASQGSLCACGYGRFMVEVSISIPVEPENDDDDDDDDEVEMRLLDRKIVLFSSAVGAITWAGASYPLHLEARPVQEMVDLAVSTSRRAACTIAARSVRSPEIIVTEIDRTGDVQPQRFIKASVEARAAIAKEDYSFAESQSLVVTPTDVVALDVLVKEVDGELNHALSFIQLFPLSSDHSQEEKYDQIALPEGYLANVLYLAGDRYIVAFCSIIKPTDGNMEELGGQWFAANDETNAPKRVAVVVSIKARCIIGQVDFDTDLELLFGGSDGTFGLSVGSRGIAITGDSVRATRTKPLNKFEARQTPSPKKKKRSSRGKRSGKKDGFARGQSLRG